jgi:hypothetical protein
MARSARVLSVGVLQTLASAILKYRGESASVVDDLDGIAHRVMEWIHHDRKDYWARELRLAWEELAQARIRLQQAKTVRKVAGQTPSCIDEERAVERAKRRVATAEEKVKAVQHWSRVLDRAMDDFQRGRTQFATWLENDLRQGVAALDHKSDALDTYVSLEQPMDSFAPPPVAGPSPDESGQAAPAAGAPDAKKKGAGP